jgi:uridine kinase
MDRNFIIGIVTGGCAAAFAAGFFISRYLERRHHAFDVVDLLLSPPFPNHSSLHHHGSSASDHHAPRLRATSHAGSGSAAGEGGNVAAAGSGGTFSSRGGGGGVFSTPPRHNTKPRQPTHPDSAFPSGSAVVAQQELVDPKGTRRHEGRNGPIIVGVAGASGSGKTSIATIIAERLAPTRVASISCDSYYKSLTHDSEPGNYNFDHPGAIDFDLLASHLEGLARGEDVEIPTYSFTTHSRLSETVRISGSHTDVVIVDGIFVLHQEIVREKCDVTIFTAEDLDICLARRLKRDLVERGRSVESVLSQYVRFVRTGYHQFVAPTMTLADFIIPRARENETAIGVLARDLERRLGWQ